MVKCVVLAVKDAQEWPKDCLENALTSGAKVPAFAKAQKRASRLGLAWRVSERRSETEAEYHSQRVKAPGLRS